MAAAVDPAEPRFIVEQWIPSDDRAWRSPPVLPHRIRKTVFF